MKLWNLFKPKPVYRSERSPYYELHPPMVVSDGFRVYRITEEDEFYIGWFPTMAKAKARIEELKQADEFNKQERLRHD